MRFYHRSQEDKINGLNRCFFDAEHARIELALERIRDIDDEFPNDAQVAYAEGLLRWDFLGQGVAARALFAKALELDRKHAFAACNATMLARTEDEFRESADSAQEVAQDDESLRKLVSQVLANVDAGASYWSIVADGAQQYFEHNEFAKAAALMEIALLSGQMCPDEELSARRARAQWIRNLDARAHESRSTIMENFPAEERLALHEAVAELDRVIGLDEYDAELWNLKSAWCYLLGQFEESIHFAEKAIELRPYNYAKPHTNKAASLWGLHRDEEALACAHEAMRQAKNAGVDGDIAQAQKLIDDFCGPRQEPSLVGTEPMIERVLNASNVTSDLETGQWKGSVDNLVKGILQRAALVGPCWDMRYVVIVAELLSDFTPETAYNVILQVAKHSQAVHEHCLHAALYVTAHSDGVRQRDAARFLVLTLFGAMEAAGIRRAYRQAILEPAAAAAPDDPMSHLDAIMRRELARISPAFPQLIAEQEPVTDAERQQAQRSILLRFAPAVVQSAQAGPPRTGCGAAIAAWVLVALSAAGTAVYCWYG